MDTQNDGLHNFWLCRVWMWNFWVVGICIDGVKVGQIQVVGSWDQGEEQQQPEDYDDQIGSEHVKRNWSTPIGVF